MLATGRVATAESKVFKPDTIYNNRYAREGKASTTGVIQRINIAAGMTMKFVSKKYTGRRPK